jgi:hypothetical protein
MRVTLTANEFANILIRAGELDRDWPWLHQVCWWLSHCTQIADRWVVLDLPK